MFLIQNLRILTAVILMAAMCQAETSEQELARLRAENAQLKAAETASLRQELSQVQAELRQVKAELAMLRQQTGRPGPAAGSPLPKADQEKRMAEQKAKEEEAKLEEVDTQTVWSDELRREAYNLVNLELQKTYGRDLPVFSKCQLTTGNGFLQIIGETARTRFLGRVFITKGGEMRVKGVNSTEIQN